MLELLTFFITIITDFFFLKINKDTKNKKNIIFLLLIFMLLLFIFKGTQQLVILIYLINNAFVLLISKNKIKKITGIKKAFITIFALFNLTLLLELTVFNFRSYTTMFYKPIHLNELNISTDMEMIKDNRFYAGKKYDDGKKNLNEIVIYDINTHINNMYIDINNNNVKNHSEKYNYDSENVNDYENGLEIVPYYTDEANSKFKELNKKNIFNDLDRSKLLILHLSGKSKKMKFQISVPRKTEIEINDIIINYKIPFNINEIRITLVFILFTFIYIFRPKSEIYKLKYNKYKKVSMIFLITMVLILFPTISNLHMNGYNIFYRDIYNRLSDSLIKGKIYIVDYYKTESVLNVMENPYDPSIRESYFKKITPRYFWDFAFYKGKYYCYFGIVPALMFHVPYKLITGINNDLSTAACVVIVSIVTAILLIRLFKRVIDRYFNNISLGMYLLLNFAMIFCTGILHCIKYEDFYVLPIITALMFIYSGLNILFSLLQNNKMVNTKLFFGSLCLALVAGCRPQLLLSSMFLIPILYLYCKENKPNKKEIIKGIICICIPYITVAILLMIYNYARFDSPFDFGAAYNLTTNDMTKRGFVPDRIPIGIFTFLFNFINTSNVFPYLIGNIYPLNTNYLGNTTYETMYGGVFFSIIITSINLFLFKLKKYINSKFIFNICIMCIVSSIIIIVADTEMAGILPRYIIDFSWLLVISSILIILSLTKNKKVNQKYVRYFVLISVSLSLIYQFFYYFCTDYMPDINNLKLWYQFYYAIQFWI